MDFNVFNTNPTSIGCKQKEFYDLINMHHLGLVACAETSATTAIQRTFGSHMMTKGFKSNWSKPVQPHVIELDGNPSLRDRAGGTADFAAFPSRKCWNGIADEWSRTNRISHALVQVASSMQVFVIYGILEDIAGAKDFTNGLFEYALEQSKKTSIPSIILGDFKLDVHKLHASEQLTEQGVQTLQALHGKLMEYQCQKLVGKKPFQIQRLYIPFLHHDSHRFRCLKDGWIDSHDPVFKLHTPNLASPE